MAQSLSKIILHLVFSTKNRDRLIKNNIQPELLAYLAGACRKLGCIAYRAGGTEDHVHVACTLPRTLTVSKLMEEIKKHLMMRHNQHRKDRAPSRPERPIHTSPGQRPGLV